MNWQLNNAPILPTPPGEILKQELKSREIKQSEFAAMVGMRPSHLSEIIKGSRPINDQLALKLEEVTGINAGNWLKMQAIYTRNLKEAETLEITEQKALNELRAYNETVDVKTIIKKYGYQEYCNGDKLSFFTNRMHFPPSAEMNVRTKSGGLWRKSEKVGLDSRMINTWASMARFAVQDIHPSGTFNKNTVQELIKELIVVFNDNNNTIARVANTMDKYGIKFCVLEKIEKASIDGYSFMDNGTPAIVVTCRIPKIDNLAFSILHELGHHILHIKGNETSYISYDSIEHDTAEDEADKFASEALIPSSEWNKLPSMPIHNAYLLQKACTTWAIEHGYNKWIVLGRISHETGMYKFKSDKTRNIN